QKGKLLGNKASLEQDICEAVGIPAAALQGSLLSALLSEFRRQNIVKQPIRQGIFAARHFNVNMPLIYSEGKDMV
ncbi:hypothetical protein BKA61DRAFT_500692, partial [Leptodontidium sp. MPI-SDFR-AT-0119]